MKLLSLSAAVVGLMAVSVGPALAMCDCCKKMSAGTQQQQGSGDQPSMPMMPMMPDQPKQ